jgi:putative effector of murein hydrolase LrgA (UPF0299 family)
VRLEERDRVDVLTLTVLLFFSFMGVYGMMNAYEKDFVWFISAVVVYAFVVNTVGAYVVYWVMKMLKLSLIDEEKELE